MVGGCLQPFVTTRFTNRRCGFGFVGRPHCLDAHPPWSAFPFDMLRAIAVAALFAWLTLREARWYLEPGYQLATSIHRRFFAGLITLGWVRE